MTRAIRPAGHNRRNTVIDNAVNAGYITSVEAENIKKDVLKVKPYMGYQGIAPNFAERVRQEVSKMPELQGYDIYRDGLIVYTTLNSEMQRAANRAVLEAIRGSVLRTQDPTILDPDASPTP